MKYKTHVAVFGGLRFRVTYARRHWFYRWQLIGVESWCPCPGDNHIEVYAYQCYKAKGF